MADQEQRLTSKSAWAASSLRSGFGDQPLSHRASAPAAGFGSSSRDAFAKQYASAEADRAQARERRRRGAGLSGRCCAGHPTSRTMRLGAHTPARRHGREATLTTTWAPATLCRWGLQGRSSAGHEPHWGRRHCRGGRPQSRRRLHCCLPSLAWPAHPSPVRSPIHLQDTLSKQVLSTVPSPPRVRFGTGKRPGMAERTDAPGPGAYKLKPVMGAWGLVPGRADAPVDWARSPACIGLLEVWQPLPPGYHSKAGSTALPATQAPRWSPHVPLCPRSSLAAAAATRPTACSSRLSTRSARHAAGSNRAAAGGVAARGKRRRGPASRPPATLVPPPPLHPQVGVDSPGPAYTIPAALGKQQLSTKKSAGAFVMPRGQRFTDVDVREAALKVGGHPHVRGLPLPRSMLG